MTTKRDLYAKYTRLLLQADGTSGALLDHSRAPFAVTPNDFASDSTDKLYGVNSFTGKPGLPGFTFGTTGTIEGYIKLAASTSDQTLFSALNGTYGRATEFGLSLRGANNRQFDFYNGVRGSSEVHSQPLFPADLPMGTWVHFFYCFSGSGAYMGVNGVLSNQVNQQFVSDHLGNASNPALINGINTAVVAAGQPWLGKTHSLMLSDGLLRYIYSSSGVYKKPDDLLTNWYSDTGVANDPPDGSNDYQVVKTTVQLDPRWRVGYGKISGHVTYTGLVSSRRVGLFHRQSRLLLAETTSRAADGYFEFLNLDTKYEYFVVGYDDTPGTINAEIADHLVPV